MSWWGCKGVCERGSSNYSLSSWVQGTCLTHITEESLRKHRSGRNTQVLSDHPDKTRELLHVLIPPHQRELFHVLLPPHHLSQEESHTTRWGTQHLLRHPSCLDFTDEILCLTVWFLKDVLTSSCGLRLLTHRLPTRMQGRLGLFASWTLSHSLFRSLCLSGWYHNSLPSPYFKVSPRVPERKRVFAVFFEDILLSSVDAYCCTYQKDVGNRLPLCEG
jgi:hypothetical protein